MYIRIRNF